MDIDRYIQRNEPTWRRLEQLSRTAARDVRKLDEDEVTELVALYQRVSSHLSHARGQYRDPDLNARLSGILGEARVIIYRRRTSAIGSVMRFFTETFPAAVWGSRRYVAVAALALFVPAIAIGAWLYHSPSVLDAAVPPEMQQLIAESEFADYYRSDAAQNFASYVTVNNIQVAFLAFALGILPIVGTGWVLVFNGMNVGVMAAVMHRAGEGAQFWGLILPHGLLELSAICVAGAAGLRLGWSLVAPGDRTRAQAFRDEGLRAVVVVGGLAVCFIIAGFIEGFVTPSGLPTALRIAVGCAALALFVVYVVLLGSRAERKGLTGLLGESTRDELQLAEAEAARGQVLTIG
uniref:Putative integral membrane protein n=1 Tax=uncultured bacterium A1Q1_fos_568 TaxID=1256586 RepID=L7VUN9_9BACT|nr:putative integral membrane protein [uncultured bacterium A1Q1_fos_568]